MLKQKFLIGETVKCDSYRFTGVHTVTAVKMEQREGQRGEPLGEVLLYQLDGDEDKWAYESNLSHYVDENTVRSTVTWIKDNLSKYLCLGEKGNSYFREEMYEDLLKHFGLKEK